VLSGQTRKDARSHHKKCLVLFVVFDNGSISQIGNVTTSLLPHAFKSSLVELLA
jgi:hypothetical protein